MSISKDKIIVLKAFYLGYEIREQNEFTEQTSKLLDNAIDQLSKKTKKADLINLLFYLIVKCELLRLNNNFKYCREKAQEIAQQINKQHMYEDYMAIVERITRAPRVVVWHSLNFVDAIDLSERQFDFLFKTNLLQIMKEHNIQDVFFQNSIGNI